MVHPATASWGAGRTGTTRPIRSSAPSATIRRNSSIALSCRVRVVGLKAAPAASHATGPGGGPCGVPCGGPGGVPGGVPCGGICRPASGPQPSLRSIERVAVHDLLQRLQPIGLRIQTGQPQPCRRMGPHEPVRRHPSASLRMAVARRADQRRNQRLQRLPPLAVQCVIQTAPERAEYRTHAVWVVAVRFTCQPGYGLQETHPVVRTVVDLCIEVQPLEVFRALPEFWFSAFLSSVILPPIFGLWVWDQRPGSWFRRLPGVFSFFPYCSHDIAPAGTCA